MEFFQEWLAEIDIDSEVETYESSKLTDVILEGTFDTFEWGWYVEPDPDSILSYLTCGQLGNWSDSWYCNEEYDALYEQQHVEMDDAARQEIVRQMQEILYRDAPYLVTAYSSIGEAFRSDRFACFQPQPDPGGILIIQYGVQNYLNVRPAAEAGDCDGIETALGASTGNGGTEGVLRRATGGGLSTGAKIGIGVTAGVAVAGAAFVLMRRTGERGRARVTVLAQSDVGAADQLAPDRQGTYGRYVLSRCLGALGSLCFMLVVSFFLFRVLPGDPARTLGRGRFTSPEQLEEFNRTYGLDQAAAAAVRHVPEEHR